MTSNCCGMHDEHSTGQVLGAVTGALALVGLAAITWFVLSRRYGATTDPLSEADRRINELEASLHRLQDTFNQAVGG